MLYIACFFLFLFFLDNVNKVAAVVARSIGMASGQQNYSWFSWAMPINSKYAEVMQYFAKFIVLTSHSELKMGNICVHDNDDDRTDYFTVAYEHAHGVTIIW